MPFPHAWSRVVAMTSAVVLSGAAAIADVEERPEPSPAASEMLETMRESGVLSEAEYEELYQRQARYELEQRQRESMPGWLRDWTVDGDLRFRYERRDFGDLAFGKDYEPGDDNVQVVLDDKAGIGVQDRFRIRLRIGAEKRINEDFRAGFRFVTSAGSEFGQFSQAPDNVFERAFQSDPRSTNVTLGGYFTPKEVFVDRAYIGWSPGFAPGLDVVAGKFRSPFVSRDFDGDFIFWDDDLSPEGMAVTYRYDLAPEVAWLEFAAAGLLIDEVSGPRLTYSSATGTAEARDPVLDDRDPFALGFQGSIEGRPEDWVQTGARVTYYDIQHISQRLAAALEDLGNGGAAIDDNPFVTDGASRGRVQELKVDAYVKFTPWGERWQIRPWAEWSTLLTAPSEDDAFVVGLEFGSLDTIELAVMHAWIQRNGTFALWTDSDLFEGLTNAKGWFVSARRRVMQGVTLRAALMRSRMLRSECIEERETGVTSGCDTATQLPLLGEYRKTTLDRTRLQFDLMVDF